jgi:hypothetical protein
LAHLSLKKDSGFGTHIVPLPSSVTSAFIHFFSRWWTKWCATSAVNKQARVLAQSFHSKEAWLRRDLINSSQLLIFLVDFPPRPRGASVTSGYIANQAVATKFFCSSTDTNAMNPSSPIQ